MPAQVNRAIRAHQVACENAGLLLKLDSVGLTIIKNQEAQGVIAKVRVNDRLFYVNGTVFNHVTGE